VQFFTRELYQSLQVMPGPSLDQAMRKWQEAGQAYNSHLAAIQSQLPATMREFSQLTFHDGVVTAAEYLPERTFELIVDASANPWGPSGWYRLRFRNVLEIQGLPDIVGDVWLYEEVHLHPKTCFEYGVLLWRSELKVVADEVEIELVPDSEFDAT
jgi:hypothetical protein